MDSLNSGVLTAATESLIDWLRIASVSSDPAHRDDVLAAAGWVENRFKSAGLSTRRIETDGFPLIFAETPPVPGAAVALVYGHYDVQPPEPLELWRSPPFEPAIVDGHIVARGATDDKGQVLTHILAVCDAVAAGTPPPIQVKFLIEGEEEIGSGNLEKHLPDLADLLACDVVVVSDSSQYGPGRPAITTGLRGIATYEIRVSGPSVDLHSGSFGGAVANPAMALCQMLASLKDADGKIAIDGFYDDVVPIPDVERDAWVKLGNDAESFAKSVGAPGPAGESGYTPDERRWARPSVDINGLTAGHQGVGVKTVLPAEATAKFSFRLVPDQDPGRLTVLIREHLEKHQPPGVRFELKPDHGAGAMVTDATGRFIDAATSAVTAAFGTAPVTIREGGSIPILASFQKTLHCQVLLLGWGQNDDGAHSPNERFSLDAFAKGITASRELWKAMGQ